MKHGISHPDKEPTIDELLRMADVASALRKQREEAGRELDFHERKEDLTRRLLDVSKQTGEKLTAEEAEAAIDLHFRGLYTFEEPQKDFSYRLTEWYVNRTAIWKNSIAPALRKIVAGGIVVAALFTGNYLYRNLQERSVERAVQMGYQKRQRLQREVDALEKRAELITELRGIAYSSEVTLENTDLFFKRFCSDGTAEDDVTRQNYKEANQGLGAVNQTLTSVEKNIEKGTGIIKLEEGLIVTRQSLDSLIQGIRGDNPPKPLLDRAETVYQSGIASLDGRNLSQGQGYASHLQGLKTDIKQWPSLQSQPEQLYNSITAVVKENKARQQAEELYDGSKSYIMSIDIPHLRNAIGRLQDLDGVLKQTYESRIVSRGGVKSGIDRYYTDKDGRRVSGYYLIVEAVNQSGTALNRQIRNEEDGKTYTVTMWGERVPEEVYERVKEDKLDDGIIQDNIFGTKRRGYVTERIVMRGPDDRPLRKEGQITSW